MTPFLKERWGFVSLCSDELWNFCRLKITILWKAPSLRDKCANGAYFTVKEISHTKIELFGNSSCPGWPSKIRAIIRARVSIAEFQAMPFSYACFVSYRHPRGRLMTSFRDQMIDALVDFIEPWVDLPVFADRNETEGGDFYDQKFAHALCRSICMVVIYSPTYFNENSDYCAREFCGMEQIENHRMLKIRNPVLKQKGHIIPIIYRGRLPDFIARKRDYKYNFSSFLLRSEDISLHEKYAQWFEEIGRRLYEIRLGFEEEGVDPVEGLNDFTLPSSEDIVPFLQNVVPQFHFPGRFTGSDAMEVGYGL